MEGTVLEIPFVLNNKNGIAEARYEVNTSAQKSGFDLLKGLDFSSEICRGYPTMYAYIKDYNGTGYSAASAWIQIITDRFYSSIGDKTPCEVVSEVDVSDSFRDLGVPFFAFGYPSEIYDAPCNNLGGYARLEWAAETFMVTYPSRINNETITFLLGFRWGYEEKDIEGKRQIEMLPLNIIDYSHWIKYLPLLKDKFPHWKYI
jgi:hypothetical protein